MYNEVMNSNSSAKTILCYGDSNTHGQIPATYSRYPANVRWTGRLQQLLGEEYNVIEEGLGGRTVDYDEPNRPGRSGYEYFVPCLSSHQPLDVIVIMLGTNDTKVPFGLSVESIVDGLRGYIESAAQYEAEVILVSPIIPNAQAPEWTFYGEGYFDETSVHKSEQLVGEVERLAHETGCTFVRASDSAKPGIDGIHMDEAAHRAFAEQLARVLNP